MKIFKLVIAFVAATFIAVGASCVLISSIAIGAQTSVSSAKKELEIEYKEDVRAEKERHTAAVKTINDSDDEAEVKAANLETENKLNEKTLRDLKLAYQADQLDLKQDRKDNIVAAFINQNVVYTTIDGAVDDTVIVEHGKTSLSPMGATMVVGLAFLFVGGALIIVNVVLKKCGGAACGCAEQPAEEVEKSEKPKTTKAKAAKA